MSRLFAFAFDCWTVQVKRSGLFNKNNILVEAILLKKCKPKYYDYHARSSLHDCSFHYSSSLSKIYLTFHIKSFKKQVVSKSVPGRFISRNCRFNFISVAGPVAAETEVE